MNNEGIGAEFSVMTQDEQGMVVGGESAIANAAGWFIAYPLSCVVTACMIQTRILNHVAPYYVDGHWY